MPVLINGALLEVQSSDAIVASTTYMEGFLLGVVFSRNPGFRASLFRVWPRTFDAPEHLPEFWASLGIDEVICESVSDGLRILKARVDALEDQSPSNYQFRKSTRTSWPSSAST